jgi:tetratricopeptide (TPR) repeat protein
MHDEVAAPTLNPVFARDGQPAAASDQRVLPAWLTSRWFAMLAVALAAVLVYANTIHNGFAYDDVWIVQNNKYIHQLRDQAQIWLRPYWPTFGKELGLYRPLTLLVFAIEWALGRGEVWVFHAVNILLHAVASVLAFMLLERMTSRVGGLAGGLVFALHPLHTEAIANVVGQAELLAAVCALLACYLHATRPAGIALSMRRAVALTALYASALLAKEGAIMLPPLLVLIDLAQGRITLTRRGIVEYVHAITKLIILMGVLVAAYLVLRTRVLGNITGTDVAPSYPFLYGAHRVLNAFRAWPEYIRLLFFPQDLSADYSPAVILPVETMSAFAFVGALVLCVTIALACATPWRPGIGFAAGWFLITVLPVSNLLYTIGVIIAERVLYLPSFAVSAYAAYGWTALARGPLRRFVLASAALAVVLVLFAARTVTRNPEWKDTKTIMGVILRDHPESYRGQWSEAVRALGRGDTAQSEQHWAYAIQLWPYDSQMLTELGAYDMQMKRYRSAARVLEGAHRLHPNVPRTEQFLAMAYLDAHEYQHSLAAIDRSVKMIGPTAYLYELRARALMGLGRNAEAVAAWRATVKEEGGNTWMQWGMMGRALAAAGNPREAALAFDTAHARAAGNDSTVAEVLRMRKFANIQQLAP